MINSVAVTIKKRERKGKRNHDEKVENGQHILQCETNIRMRRWRKVVAMD
jgi:hypothetical protein